MANQKKDYYSGTNLRLVFVATVFMLRVLYALVPCLCNVVSIAIISFYPISEEKHIQIRSKIAHREQQHS